MFYDFFSKKYKSNQITKLGALNASRYHQKVCHTMGTFQPAPALVLEIGPGTGRFAERCVEMRYSYIGIEFNRELLSKLALNYQMVCGLVPPLPFQSESVHIIVADQIVEHMPTFREALYLLSECYRVLKPSGFLVLGFPDYIRMGLPFYDRDYSHSFLTTENRVDQILRDVGFEPLKTVRFTGSVSNPLFRLLLDFIMMGINARLTSLIANDLGANRFLDKIHKTFVASSVLFSQKGPVHEDTLL